MNLISAEVASLGKDPNRLSWGMSCKSIRGCNFHHSILERTMLWNDPESLRRLRVWQHHVGYKLKGLEFARALGVETAKVYDCVARPDEFKAAQLHVGYVAKPVDGFSSQDVFVVKHGEIANKSMDPKSNWKRGFMVEELIQHFDNISGLADYKFLMFGRKIGAVLVVSGRLQSSACPNCETCRVWVDENFERLDSWGCTNMNICGIMNNHKVVKYRSQKSGNKFVPCPDEIVVKLRPPFWDKMVNDARTLGVSVGVAMRVDFFASSRGPLLSEFTPFPTHGTVACVITQRSSIIDHCILDRAWNHLYLAEKTARKLEAEYDTFLHRKDLLPFRNFINQMGSALCNSTFPDFLPKSCRHLVQIPVNNGTVSFLEAIRTITCDISLESQTRKDIIASLYELPYPEESYLVVKKTQRKRCPSPVKSGQFCPDLPFAI
mmetsp:Transcript_3603/g.5053  ORF Transcript_3603/g.5053 Transcript_3603/m.5053 type:complete len:435 (+) Transcript_3603:224-1528(+)